MLEEVAAGPVALNVIASRLNLSRSTVHRLASSLIERRYLTLAPRRGYSLGPKLLELGSRARGQISLVRTARPFLEMLAEATGDAVLLAVREGDSAIIADSVAGARRVAPRLRVGERLDLLRHAAGRALLLDHDPAAMAALPALLARQNQGAALAQPSSKPASEAWDQQNAAFLGAFLAIMRRAAAAGLARDDEAADAEIVSLACPVRGADGSIRASLGVALAATYKRIGLGAAAQTLLRQSAESLSQELGWRRAALHDAQASTEAERELLGGLSSAASAQAGGLDGAVSDPPSGQPFAALDAERETSGAHSPGSTDTMEGEDQNMKVGA